MGSSPTNGTNCTPVAERRSTGLLTPVRGFDSHLVSQTKAKTMSDLKLDYDAIKEHIANSHPESVIMIGCDSVRKEHKGIGSALYSTVVCIRRASGSGNDIMYHGSKIFGASVRLPDYGKVIRSGKIANLQMRLMQEVTFALEAFENLQYDILDRPWEIHIDINSDTQAESNVALAAARGYVMGVTGKEPNFKPTALAASFAADLHAHGHFN